MLKKPVILILRLGAHCIAEQLPSIVRFFKNTDVSWVCDPMHGNTEKLSGGLKTRHISKIQEEVDRFFDILFQERVMPLGLHLESTAHPAYECLDHQGTAEMIAQGYQSACDPRLNAKQTIDIINLSKEHFLWCREKI